MIISMKQGASREQIDHVRERIIAFGYKVHSIEGEERVVIGAVGVGDTTPAIEQVESAPGVESVTPISQPCYKVVSRQMQPLKTSDQGRWHRNRRGQLHRNGRPLLGRE